VRRKTRKVSGPNLLSNNSTMNKRVTMMNMMKIQITTMMKMMEMNIYDICTRLIAIRRVKNIDILRQKLLVVF